jgi:hypothetical protein
MPAIASASVCAVMAAGGHRAHGATEDGRRYTDALIGFSIDPQSARHGLVVDQRRVHVDVALDDGIGIDKGIAKDQPHHGDGIAGTVRRGDAAHERLCRKCQVGQHHVQVALVDGHIDGLANRAAGMMQPRRHPGELDEIPEVFQRGIAPTLVQIGHEGRAVSRHQDEVIAAKLNRHARFAAMKQEAGRRVGTEFAHVARLEPDAATVNPGASLPEQVERDFVAAKLDADAVEDPVCLLLDQCERRLIQQPVGGNDAAEAAAIQPNRRCA